MGQGDVPKQLRRLQEKRDKEIEQARHTKGLAATDLVMAFGSLEAGYRNYQAQLAGWKAQRDFANSRAGSTAAMGGQLPDPSSRPVFHEYLTHANALESACTRYQVARQQYDAQKILIVESYLRELGEIEKGGSSLSEISKYLTEPPSDADENIDRAETILQNKAQILKQTRPF